MEADVNDAKKPYEFHLNLVSHALSNKKIKKPCLVINVG